MQLAHWTASSRHSKKEEEDTQKQRVNNGATRRRDDCNAQHIRRAAAQTGWRGRIAHTRDAQNTETI